MKLFLAIFISKITIMIGKLLHKGSSTPGAIALKIDKNLMSKFTLPKTIIAVTGSSGKGSTSKMIADAIRKSGKSVVHNEKGSNLEYGIATLLIENATLTGKIKKDVLVFEIDERYTKIVFKNIKPNFVVITNITRDQPPRQGHFDLVYREIKKALTNDMHLILNGDDPYLQKFNLEKNFKITYYGIDKNKYSYTKNKFSNLNINYCPRCSSKLNYNFYNFEYLGNYYCSNCDFKTPKIDFLATKLNYDKNELIINDKYTINNCSDILYSAYNTLAAYTTLSLIGINENEICKYLSSNKKTTYGFYEFNNRKCFILNNKNENSASFNQSLLFLDEKKDKKTIIIGWKEISRRYNFDDLSWLYDIEFELLKKHDIDKIICVGPNRYDIATRIKYADIDNKKIKVIQTLDEATDYIKKNTNGNIYAILNFDYVIPFTNLMNGCDK